jgi:hypothetical protein
VVRKLIFIVTPLLALSSSGAMAQRGFSGGHAGSHFTRGFGAQHRGRYSGGYPLGPGYWGSLFSDDDTEYPPAAPPGATMQPPDARTGASGAQFPSPAEPMLIELQGGRYVQVSGKQSSGDNDPGAVLPALRPGAVETSRASVAQASTILVFRNGNREQITGYTIVDGVLYAQASYYTDGSWNQPISLSSLDVAETMDANRARGVPFQLPGSPNEVIVGP